MDNKPLNTGWGHPLSTYAKFSEKLTFVTPWYAHVRLRIRGLEMLDFRKIFRTYLMNGPNANWTYIRRFEDVQGIQLTSCIQEGLT